MTDAATRVTLLRHGEVAGPPHVLRGKHDVPLSPAGWRQMRDAIGGATFSAIAASPLARCRAFAESLAEECKLPITLHAGLEETDFGDWEGMTTLEAQTAAPDLFQQFQSNPEGLAPPRGEAFNAFRERALDAFNDCLAQRAGGHVLIVTHAGVMRVVLSEMLALPWQTVQRFALPPAGSFQLSCLPGHAPYLLSLNRGQSCAA